MHVTSVKKISGDDLQAHHRNETNISLSYLYTMVIGFARHFTTSQHDFRVTIRSQLEKTYCSVLLVTVLCETLRFFIKGYVQRDIKETRTTSTGRSVAIQDPIEHLKKSSFAKVAYG